MPNWEKDTGFGKVVDRLSLDNFGLFVHVGNVEQAELIRRINSFHIRNQLVLIDEPEDFWDVHGGIIALRAAQMTSGQKKRFQLPLLVFGRSVLADVSLTQTGRQGIAQFHFGLEIINEIWVVQHLGGKWTKVNGVLLKEKNQVYALHPKMPNRVQIQGIELGLYCRNTRLFDMDDQESLLTLPLPLPPLRSTQPHSILSLNRTDNPDPLYLLKKLTSRSHCRTRWLSLDPWTCDRWIAKTFAGTVQEQERLKAHIDLLEGLPVESFIRDEQVKAQGGQFLSLSRYRPNVWPLSELDGAETPDQQQYRGRRLLWNLLRLVARVHKLGITHRDICMDTVFLSDEEDYESILLGGFSEAVSDMCHARSDCQLVFRTVESFFGEVSLPPNWIGNAALDRLWSSGYSDIDSWPTPQQLCEDIRAFDNDERWSTISVSVQYAIKRMCDEAGDFVMTDAVRPYVAKHLVRHGYKDKMARALAVLQEGSYEGRIYLDVYRRVDKKMRREDVEIPYLDMDFLGSEDNQTVAEVSFEVLCHLRYGLISLSNLVELAPEYYDLQRLRPLSDRYYEVRGHNNIEGIFVPISSFPAIAQELSLVHGLTEFPPVDPSLEDYTRDSWFLWARNESSSIIPVSRESRGKVSDSGRTYKLGESIENPYESVTEFDLDALLDQDTGLDFHTDTSIASVESSDSGLRFEFGRTNRWLGNLPRKRKHTQSFDPELEDDSSLEEAKKRIFRHFNKADIIPTKFT